MSPRNPQKFVPNQPTTYNISFKAILSFPFRLCNPPPAVGKVRSCSVTPLLNVRLEDVLERKHLPPLGLKDFEEWLLFVELSPENLYFILWLREYKQRYNQWKSQPAFQSRNPPNLYPLEWPNPHSSHLAMFYARAKQTFFTPGSEYELNLTSSLLAPFHKANNSPHPDPAMFIDVELETYRTLEESLRRFVHAQLNNVGNKRVLCGLIAGLLFCLIGTVPPLVTSFLSSPSRWPRLAAFPGLWLGITIILASINGVCLGVYVFGDLRQLRKFELSRPPISKPQPLPAFKPRSFVPNTSRPLSAANSILPMQQQPVKPIVPTPITDIPHPVRPLHRPPALSPSSSSSVRLSGESERTESTEDNIYISPAYYDDEDDMDGCDYFVDTESYDGQKDEERRSSSTPDSFTGATAGFIRPFVPISDDEDEFDRSLSLPAKHQIMTPFNFDSLPSRPRNTNTNRGHPSTHPNPHSHPNSHNNNNTTQNHQRPAPPPPLNTFLPIQIPCPPEPAASPSFIGRMQERCGIAKWRLQTGFLEPASPSSCTSTRSGSGSGILPPHPSSPYWATAHANHSTPYGLPAAAASSSIGPTPIALMSVPVTVPVPGPSCSKTRSESDGGTGADIIGMNININMNINIEAKVKRRFRVMNAVPAFAVPLTRVLSPVIARGQWEIVVRSAMVAFWVAWTIVGTLLAVPPVVGRPPPGPGPGPGPGVRS